MYSPVKAIREKCLECSSFQPKEVRLCPHSTCALYPFRFGKNPNRSKACVERGSKEKISCSSEDYSISRNKTGPM
jgi:hypothetical protein